MGEPAEADKTPGADAVVEAVRAAIDDAPPEADADALAERIVDRITATLHVPSAHDVADVIAPLIPTPADVADVVSDRMVDRLPAVITDRARSAEPAPRPTLIEPRVTIAHLEVELASLHEQLQSTQRVYASLVDEVTSSARRNRDQTEALSTNVADSVARVGRRLDERLDELRSERMTPLLANAESLERGLRAGLDALAASVERLDNATRRIERSSDPRTLARLTRTLGVIVATLGLEGEVAEAQAAAPLQRAAADEDIPRAGRDDNTLHLIGGDAARPEAAAPDDSTPGDSTPGDADDDSAAG